MRSTQVIVGIIAAAAAIGAPGGAARAVPIASATLAVDVIVINDDEGTLPIIGVRFQHLQPSGNPNAGSDSDPAFCTVAGGDECYTDEIPVGPGELTVTRRGGYTTTIECRVNEEPAQDLGDTESDGLVAEAGASTASGATWDADPFAEIFCLVTLDDIPSNPTTTEPPVTDPPATTQPAPTTIPPVTEPPVTDPPATTQPAPAAAAPATIPPVTDPPTTPSPSVLPATELPSTGSSNNTSLALVALLLVAIGTGALRLARR